MDAEREASSTSNQDLHTFFAIRSATATSDCGIIGLLLQPGRDEVDVYSPGSHRVTGCAAISRSSRAASASRVSPINVRFLGFSADLRGTFLCKLIEISDWSEQGWEASEATAAYVIKGRRPLPEATTHAYDYRDEERPQSPHRDWHLLSPGV